jgi:hypothetical protein
VNQLGWLVGLCHLGPVLMRRASPMKVLELAAAVLLGIVGTAWYLPSHTDTLITPATPRCAYSSQFSVRT